ncbi:MAG: hypothetical protein DRI46_09605 [Chloroflexi bacterium]|nr:MAG: hypothetical protein DRI46_09605 [Chloroflexota bacterium]
MTTAITISRGMARTIVAIAKKQNAASMQLHFDYKRYAEEAEIELDDAQPYLDEAIFHAIQASEAHHIAVVLSEFLAHPPLS